MNAKPVELPDDVTFESVTQAQCASLKLAYTRSAALDGVAVTFDLQPAQGGNVQLSVRFSPLHTATAAATPQANTDAASPVLAELASPAASAAATAGALLRGFDANRDCGQLIDRIVAAKVDFVARYYSHNTEKNLSFSEARLLSGAGIKMVAVWEAQGDKATSFSHTNGVDDSTSAYNFAATIGQPVGTPIYFAVDFDAVQPIVTGAIHDYFQGVADGFATISHNNPAYAIGVYGSGLVCSWLKGRGLVTRTWLSQSMGWTGSRDFKSWNILQHLSGDPYGFGFTIDPNDARPDYGGFSVGDFTV